MTRPSRRWLIAVVWAIIVLAPPLAASAAPAAVSIRNFLYTPPSVTIFAGETVTWTNLDPTSHSALSTTRAFDSGVLSPGQSRAVTFASPGTFPYICGFHGDSMSGSVRVLAAATGTPTPAPTPPPTAPATVAPTPVATVAPAPTAPPATPVPATAAPTTAPPPSVAPISVAQPSPSPARAATATPSPEAGGPDAAPLAVGAAAVVALASLAFALRRRR